MGHWTTDAILLHELIYFSGVKKRILLHLLFWLTYLVWGGFVLGSYDGNYNRSFMNDLVQLPVKMAVTYFMMYYMLPRYIQKRNTAEQWALFALAFIAGTLLFRIAIWKIIQPVYYPESEFHFWNAAKILMGAFDVFSIAAIAVSIKLFKLRYQSFGREQELEKEKLKAELRFLKAQLNPHFLFNTLNNIYGLSLKNSPRTSESILKLSSMLHFMLYEGSAETVPVAEEVNALNDYLELEKLRYGDRLILTFETDLDDASQQIAPMLLLSFAENSFKHGASESRNDSYIALSLRLRKGSLTFIIINSKEGENYNETGIGLTNIKRQLELTYGNAYRLDIENMNDRYTVTLTIELNHHAKTQLSDH